MILFFELLKPFLQKTESIFGRDSRIVQLSIFSQCQNAQEKKLSEVIW